MRSRLLPLLASFCVLGILYVVIALWGKVHETQFSPDRLVHRWVNYYEIPILELRVTPKRTGEWTTPLEEYLHEEGYVPAAAEREDRWYFVKGWKTGVRGWHGEAWVMWRTLRTLKGSAWDTTEWVEWSKEYPDHAKILWPLVVRLARDERFDDVGYIAQSIRLYSLAEDPGTPEEFEEFINAHLSIWREP